MFRLSSLIMSSHRNYIVIFYPINVRIFLDYEIPAGDNSPDQNQHSNDTVEASEQKYRNGRVLIPALSQSVAFVSRNPLNSIYALRTASDHMLALWS